MGIQHFVAVVLLSVLLGLPASTASIVIGYFIGVRCHFRSHGGCFFRQLPQQIWQTSRFDAHVNSPFLWRDVCLIRTARRPEHCGARGLAASKYRNFAGEFLFLCRAMGAIAAELSEDYDERTIIIAYRMLIGLVGGGLFIFLYL